MSITNSTFNSTSCITYLPDDTEIKQRVHLTIAYYKNKISYIDSLFTKKDLPTVYFKGKKIQALISEVFEKKIDYPFKQINDELIYSFKTDFTKYFDSKNPIISEYISVVAADLHRVPEHIVLFQKGEYKIISFTNLDRLVSPLKLQNKLNEPNYVAILNYGVCLLNNLFNSNLSLIDENEGTCCNNNQISRIIIDVEPDVKNDRDYLYKSFTEIEIPGIEGRSISNSRPINIKQNINTKINNNNNNNNKNNKEINTLKCILSNLVFTHQSYKLTCNHILITFFKHISADLMKLMNADIFIHSGGGVKYGYDLCINNDNKTFNIIINIVCMSPAINVENNTIVIGKLIHVIPFNTLEDITSGKLNDSYIIIETFEDFSTAKKIFDYINKMVASQNAEEDLKILHKKRSLQNSSLFNKLFRKTKHNHQNKLFSTYYNAIPSQNYSKVNTDNANKLYKEMSGFILTDNIATIFNFLIHISPYKSFITQNLFNLNEKITYLTNRKNKQEYDSRTIDNFDFDTSEMFDVYNGGMYEDAYKMFFCTKKLNFEIDKSLLGEKLFHFFSDQNNKHIFVGFIMNYPKESMPGFLKKFAHGGHMNSFIIDKKNKIIIRFEPKGKESPYYCNITESEFKQYIIDSLNEYKNKLQMTTEEPNHKIALPANINVGELNNNTASLIGYNNNSRNNNSRNNRDIYNMISSENGYMTGGGNNVNYSSNSNNSHNNEEIKPAKRQQPFIQKPVINAVLHDEYENEYDAMINVYTYIDTSNITNINNLTKKNNGNKNNYTIRNYEGPQQKFFDDYCQTYSLYGVLLYCMNADSIPNFDTERQKAVYTTIKLFEQITQTQEKVIHLQAFIKEKLLIFMPGLMNQAIAANKMSQTTQNFSNDNSNYDIKALGNNDSFNNVVEKINHNSKKTIPLIHYTDEIKTINTNLQKILDIIQGELRDRSTKNNRSDITKILRYYIDNLQTTPYNSTHNSQNNAKVKIQYVKKKKSLGIFSKSKIHETLEAQNYYKLLLEANFFSKIITLLNNDINYHTNNKRKQSMLLRFNKFLDKNPKYSNDMFNKATNEILTAIDTLKRMNNKTSKNINTRKINTKKINTIKNNNISNTGYIDKKSIVKIDTQEYKDEIINIIYKTCNTKNLINSNIYGIICVKLQEHIKKLEDTYKKYLKSQKIFFKNKQHIKTLEQNYYRLLLECDLIAEIIKLSKIISNPDKVLSDLFIFIENNNNYSIENFNAIKENFINRIHTHNKFNTNKFNLIDKITETEVSDILSNLTYETNIIKTLIESCKQFHSSILETNNCKKISKYISELLNLQNVNFQHHNKILAKTNKEPLNNLDTQRLYRLLLVCKLIYIIYSLDITIEDKSNRINEIITFFENKTYYDIKSYNLIKEKLLDENYKLLKQQNQNTLQKLIHVKYKPLPVVIQPQVEPQVELQVEPQAQAQPQPQPPYDLYRLPKSQTSPNFIKNSNNNILIKTQNNKTFNTNIQIIKSYIKTLQTKHQESLVLQKYKKNHSKNSTYTNKIISNYDLIINFLQSNIDNLKASKTNFITKTKKSSFFNKLKKNTANQTNSKQSYYRLLLETNLIAEIISSIKNNDSIIDLLISFKNFVEKHSNNYSFEDFNKKRTEIKQSMKKVLAIDKQSRHGNL
jgi:hypothetical protein